MKNIEEFEDYIQAIDDGIMYDNHLIEPLCNRAKEILLQWYRLNTNTSCVLNFIYNYLYTNFDKKLTPIEQIFQIAYHFYLSINDSISDKNMFLENIVYQKEVYYKDKMYIADFIIDISEKNKYIIELDGFNYHSTKAQMNYDYERENNLKKIGFKVIRFTGSQVYNKPLKTIHDLFTLILNDLNREI